MFFLQQLSKLDLERIVQADSVAKAKMDTKLHALMDMSFEDILRNIISGAIDVLWKIVVSLIVYYIGRWIIRRVKKIFTRIFERRNVDQALRNFLLNMTSISLTIVLVIIIVDILGLNTTGLIAIFASAGLAVGMAMSGTLQNFAGGVMLLLLKPYRIGDYIETQGSEGTVQNIQLFSTIITTTDNKTTIIPNSQLSNNTLKNFTREPTRRVQWELPVDYGDDFALVSSSITKILESDSRVLETPVKLVAISSFNDSYIVVRIRAWTNSENYWPLFYDMNSRFFTELPEMGVTFPFPQLDINIKQQDNIPAQKEQG